MKKVNKSLIFTTVVGLFLIVLMVVSVLEYKHTEAAAASEVASTGYIETIDTPGNAVHIFSRCYGGAKYLVAISGSKFAPEDRRHTVTIMYGADGKILACNNR